MRAGWILALSLGVAAFVLGVWGFAVAEDAGAAHPVVRWLNIVWRTAAMFAFETGLDGPMAADWRLAVARLLAPAATAVAVYQLGSDWLASRWALWRLRNLRGHTVIVGHGHVGRALLGSCDLSQKVAVIERDPGGARAVSGRGRGPGPYRLAGDARDPATLANVAAAHAKAVMIATGDDAVNLEILRTLLGLRPPLGQGGPEPLLVLVRVDRQALARQLEREERFVRWTDVAADDRPRRPVEIAAFGAARVAARRFLAEHPLLDLVGLRAQPRLHMVCVGWSDFVFEVLEQVARLSPCGDLGRPRIDLFAPAPGDVRSHLEAAQPALLDADAGVLDLHLHDLDNESGVPTADQMRAVEPDGPATVSAVVVSLASDDASSAAAIAIRERSAIEGRWNAPVFAHLRVDSALSEYLEGHADRPDAADRVVPVGTAGRCCTVEAILGAREATAKALHLGYLRNRRIAAVEESERGDSEREWSQLRQTYRIANRRAADHVPIKLLSAGYVFRAGERLRLAPDDGFAADPDELEMLAVLEHRSWEIDRRLDGWRPGAVRDDRRRINPFLGVAYEELSEAVKDYDRTQVRTVAAMLRSADAGALARRDLPIGLIGHNRISADEKARVVAALEDVLAALVESLPGRHVSLLTPLAPGSDTILAEAALDVLGRTGTPHRLAVVETLPRAAVIADFRETLEAGGEWRLADRTGEGAGDAAMAVLAEHLDAVIRRSPAPVVVNLVPAGAHLADWLASAGRRRDAYRRANAWLVSRCEVILAFHDRTRTPLPGGTGEALSWATGSEMPPELGDMCRGGRRTPPRVIELPQRIVAPPVARPQEDRPQTLRA